LSTRGLVGGGCEWQVGVVGLQSLLVESRKRGDDGLDGGEVWEGESLERGLLVGLEKTRRNSTWTYIQHTPALHEFNGRCSHGLASTGEDVERGKCSGNSGTRGGGRGVEERGA